MEQGAPKKRGFPEWKTSRKHKAKLPKGKPFSNPKPKTILRYVYSEKEKERLKGRKDYFVFPIKEQILWIDEITGGKFDSRHYSPLVYEEIPFLKRGTIAYEDYWDEQDRRCLEGYTPVINGIEYPRITGPHYFYLNMFQILMLHMGELKKRLGYPYYRALDHMIFLELEKAGKDGYGIIIAKARRMGLSYIGALFILYNLLFFKDNTCAVGAGLEDKAMKLYEKIVKAITNMREEYKVSYRKSKNLLKLVYEISNGKVREDHGIGSQLDVKTFFNNPAAFEGGSYSAFIFEEIGLQDNLVSSYKSSEPCFMEGHKQFGVPFLFGTGGEVDKGSKGFTIMYGNPAAYNLKKLLIPAFMYYPGEAVEEGKEVEDEYEVGANFFDVRTGLTDEKRALEHILERRARARKSKEGYIKEVQARPIKESDIFLKTSGGLLNRLTLSAQREAIYNKENKYTYSRGRYEWNDTDEIRPLLGRCSNTKEKNKLRIKYKITVRFIKDEDGTAYMLDGFQPINGGNMPYNPDIGGIDSYDEEGMEEHGSMGCSIIYRCFNGVSTDYDLPVAFIHERGDGTSEDTFFENTLMQAVYWKTEMLVEYTKIAILNYFKDVNAFHLLRGNPNINRELVVNKGRQEYGVKMTGGKMGFKSLVTTLLKNEVKENCQNIHFEKIIDDLIDYGDVNTDIAMAFGVVLIHKLDIFDYITDDLDEQDVDGDLLMSMSHYVVENGQVKISAYDSIQEDFGGIEVFDPRKHLTGEERENYLNFVSKRREQALQEREKKESAFIEAQRAGDVFQSQINEHLNNNK